MERSRLRASVRELAKIRAFLRRDFLIAWSYRASFFSEIIGMFVAAVTFYFVGLMVNESVLPSIRGDRPTYMEFAAVGIVFGAVIAVGAGQVATAVRQEQLMGTLESLLMTPTSPTVIQLGSVAYPLMLLPVRTGLFLALIAVAFGLDFAPGGIAPAAVVFILFTPFVWGLGLLSAAAVMTFKRGTAGVGLLMTTLVLLSGAYFPLALMPRWVEVSANANPLALAIGGVREALLSDAGWGSLSVEIWLLGPMATVSFVAGVTAFRLAVRRERRRGTLGLY